MCRRGGLRTTLHPPVPELICVVCIDVGLMCTHINPWYVLRSGAARVGRRYLSIGLLEPWVQACLHPSFEASCQTAAAFALNWCMSFLRNWRAIREHLRRLRRKSGDGGFGCAKNCGRGGTSRPLATAWTVAGVNGEDPLRTRVLKGFFLKKPPFSQ